MPEYIDPVILSSGFGDTNNTRSSFSGSIGSDVNVPAITVEQPKASTLPGWVIVAAVVGFILFATSNGR